MQKELDPNAVQTSHVIVGYTCKEQVEVSKVIGARCERLNLGGCKKRRTWYTTLSMAAGDETIEWVKEDTFAVVSWKPNHQEVSKLVKLVQGHSSCRADETSRSYRFDDREIITAHGFTVTRTKTSTMYTELAVISYTMSCEF